MAPALTRTNLALVLPDRSVKPAVGGAMSCSSTSYAELHAPQNVRCIRRAVLQGGRQHCGETSWIQDARVTEADGKGAALHQDMDLEAK